MKLFRTLVIVGLCIGLHAGAATAQSVLSNLTGSYSTTGTNLGVGNDGVDRTKGVGVTIGGSVNLIFQSMQAIISNPDGVGRQLTGGIFSDVGGNPGAVLANFNTILTAPGSSQSNLSLTTATPFTLVAGMTYWFVLDGRDPASGGLLWNGTNPNTSPTASGGVTFVGYRFSSNGGTTWADSTTFNAMQINAAPVPEPSSWTMIAAGAGMLVAFKRRRRRRRV
jgi:hypothetical protein